VDPENPQLANLAPGVGLMDQRRGISQTLTLNPQYRVPIPQPPGRLSNRFSVNSKGRIDHARQKGASVTLVNTEYYDVFREGLRILPAHSNKFICEIGGWRAHRGTLALNFERHNRKPRLGLNPEL